jgi:hypothetical protein
VSLRNNKKNRPERTPFGGYDHDEFRMNRRSVLAGAAATAFTARSMAQAQQPVSIKIGVLNDRSGLYADLTGEGSALAARMAVRTSAPPPRASTSRSSPPTTRTSRTSAPTSPASGTTTTPST